MNNIKTLIPRILGSFWDKLFHDSGLVKFIKDTHYRLSKPLYEYFDSVDKGSSCLSDAAQYTYEYKSIPVDDCIISTSTINDYVLEGTVYQHSKIRTLAIPTYRIGKPAVVISGHTWVAGINMAINDDYVTLYMPSTSDLITDVRVMSGQAINNYILYVCNKSNRSIYRNYSELVGIDLDRVSDTVRKTLWKSSVLGSRESDVNSLLSYLIGNDVSLSNTTIQELWRECGKYLVSTTDGHVYSGCGIPIVRVGSTVHVGDLLFYGLHKFDKHTLPHTNYVPSLTIKTSVGDILARNAVIKPIATNKGYIPDMCNKTWSDKISELSNRKIMLESGDPINPLHYAMKRILPPSGYIYSISDIECTDGSTVKTITDHVSNGIPSSGVSPIYRHYTVSPISTTVICEEPQAGVHTESVCLNIPLSVNTPIVHII